MEEETKKETGTGWGKIGMIASVISLVLVLVMGGMLIGMQKKLSEVEKQTKKNAEFSDGINEIEDMAKNASEQSEKTNKTIDAALKVASNLLNIDIDLTDLDNLDIDSIMNQVYDVHEVWDDTAVVAAYKSGDASALTDDKDKYVLETASKIIEEQITDDMTDYEKEKAIYDWLVYYTGIDVSNMSAIGDAEEYSHMPYGVLKYHTAICVGDATTFKLFMDMLDIECMIIHSVTNGEHAWDLVKIGDNWYHVDVLFDGGSATHPAYEYFNVTDNEKKDGSYPWDYDAYPASTSYEYCYLVQTAEELTDIYSLPKLLSEKIADHPSQLRITFVVSDDIMYEMESTVESISSGYLEDEGQYAFVSDVKTIEGKNYVTIMYNNENGSDEPVITEESVTADIDYDKLDEEIQKYFGN